MATKLNLTAYFDRIGYDGPHADTLDILKTLHLLHPKAIPFENLNPMLGIPVPLDLESIQQKLIFDGRGGYCFEHNLLFKQVLEVLGFGVKGLAARVMWNRPENEITSRGHMLLLVNVHDRIFISDVGFGGLGPTGPLLLETGMVQETPHENYRLMQKAEEYILQSVVKGEWKPLYRFNLDEHYLQDYEVTNWYLSNHPESHFVTGLFAARPEINPNRRYALRGNELSVHTIGKGTEKQTFRAVSEIRNILEENFLLSLPDTPKLNKKLEQLLNGNEN